MPNQRGAQSRLVLRPLFWAVCFPRQISTDMILLWTASDSVATGLMPPDSMKEQEDEHRLLPDCEVSCTGRAAMQARYARCCPPPAHGAAHMSSRQRAPISVDGKDIRKRQRLQV